MIESRSIKAQTCGRIDAMVRNFDCRCNSFVAANSGRVRLIVMIRSLILVLVLALSVVPVRAGDDPTAQERRQQAQVKRYEDLRAALTKLDLTPEQNDSIEKVKRDIATLIATLSQGGDGSAEAASSRELIEQTRRNLESILTEAQQNQLRRAMQLSAQPPPPERAPTPPSSQNVERISSARSSKSTVESLMRIPAPAAQMPAPAVSLFDLKGHRFNLPSTGRPVVLVFGSWSSPSLREKMELLNRLAESYSKRVHFVFIYTREVHAVGDWEVRRNSEEEIALDQPPDLPSRIERAALMRSRLHPQIALTVDDVDDTTVRTWGLFPNGAALIDRQQTIVALQKWFDPIGLEIKLKALLNIP